MTKILDQKNKNVEISRFSGCLPWVRVPCPPPNKRAPQFQMLRGFSLKFQVFEACPFFFILSCSFAFFRGFADKNLTKNLTKKEQIFV